MYKDRMSKDKLTVEQEDKSYDNDLCCEDKYGCSARVISEPHCTCSNTPITPTPNIPVCGNVVVKIPVVLAETTITIPLVSHIKLETKAAEIKRIRKNVFIKQCHLIPGSVTCTHPGPYDPPAATHVTPPPPLYTGVLNIAGFVRKNIEYATRDCSGKGVMSGRINHSTFDIPFSCTTTVLFTVKPVFVPNIPTTEIETLQENYKSCDVCAENIMGNNTCERNFSHFEVFNERVFCELVSACIFESDIDMDPVSLGCNSPMDFCFDEVTEKMVVNVTLKLLQKQQVKIESKHD